MNQLTDTQKTLLAMLKNRDPERYRIKLEQYGVQESDILDSIHKEQERRLALKLIERATFSKPKSPEPVGHEYYMGGKPYWSREPLPQTTHNCVVKQVSPKVVTAKTRKAPADSLLIIVDGDNHVYEAIDGIDKVKDRADIEVYVADVNLKTKLKEDYGIDAKAVEPGPQAVDNRIKSEAGQRYSNGESVYIVSQDKGFSKYAKKKDNAGKKIHAVKSVIDIRRIYK